MPLKSKEESISIVGVPEIVSQRIIQSGASVEFSSVCGSVLGPF